MILRAKHHFFIYPFFQKYTLWKVKKIFHEVKILGELKDNNKPLLIISNHVSWWDGFWLMYLNLKLLKRKFHFMMLESQLRKFWFFNYSGGFSVNKNSRTIFETIDYTANLLSDTENMVIIFPQGEINSIHNQKISFEKGIERIIKKLKNEITILFVANLTDYFSNPKPTIFQYIKEYNYEKFNFLDFENSYQKFYSESVENQIKIKNS